MSLRSAIRHIEWLASDQNSDRYFLKGLGESDWCWNTQLWSDQQLDL